MARVLRGMSLGMTTVAVAVIVVVGFLWMGPGVDAFVPASSAATLFDEDGVVAIYQRVSPAVVEVNTGRGDGPGLLSLGAGSGFLIDTEGHIVTNNHVVEGATNVKVTFSNGTTADATLLGRNPANDIALLKVDPSLAAGIQPVTLGDSSQLHPGQMAIAIGNPFGLEGSVTVGVISQVGRDLPSELGRPIPNVIQTDALINPGNSGGPLLDSTGAVVGINTAIQVSSVSGPNPGIGFAVPVDSLKNVLPRLKTESLITPPWLGIRATDIDAQLAERLGLPVNNGVYVVGVTPGSPAEEVGIVESGLGSGGAATTGGDIITAVDGVGVDSTAALVSHLNTNQPGDPVTLTINRGGETISVVATLAGWPEDGALRETPRFERHEFREFFRGPRGEDNGGPPSPFDRFFPRPFRR